MGDFRFPESPSKETRGQLYSAMLGGFIAGCGYMALGLTFEFWLTPPVLPPGTIRLSYGQQAILLAGVASGLGAMCGWSGSLILQSRRVLGIFVASIGLIAAFCVAAFLWVNQRTRYGVDPSEWILYPPLIMEAIGLWLLVVAMLPLSLLRPRNRILADEV